MPRDGSGRYSLPNAPLVANTPAKAQQVQGNLDDLADALTGSLPRNGSAAMQAVLRMGTFRITELGNPVNAGDAIPLGSGGKMPEQYRPAALMTDLQGSQGFPTPNNTDADVAWKTLGVNTLGAVQGGQTSYGQLIAPADGVYLITAAGEFAPNTNGQRILRLVDKNAQYLAVDRKPAASGVVNLSCSRVVPLGAGDLVKAQVYQDSGGALVFAGNPQSFFQMVKL